MSEEIIEIDGAYLEGGGQILRTACALAVVTKKPCHVFNIRRGRPKPGLMPQHLLGTQALSQLCNGRLEGDFLGSEKIKFYPGEISAKDLYIKIETAGSITLVLQTLILPALFSSFPIKITFNGGATDTFFSPTIDYFRYVFLKILEKMKLTENGSPLVGVNILRRGYYPEGGAKVEVKVFPSPKAKETCYHGDRHDNKLVLEPLTLTERGNLQRILIISGASEFLKNPEGPRPFSEKGGAYGAGKKVAERQIAGTREVLGKLKLPIEERIEYYPTQCPGSQICLIAEFENTVIGIDNLGKLGKRAEDVGKEAALELLKEQKSQACLDKHLADQVLPFMALTKEESQVTVSEITNHCKTNIWVIEKFLDGKFEINENLISWVPKISLK